MYLLSHECTQFKVNNANCYASLLIGKPNDLDDIIDLPNPKAHLLLT